MLNKDMGQSVRFKYKIKTLGRKILRDINKNPQMPVKVIVGELASGLECCEDLSI